MDILNTADFMNFIKKNINKCEKIKVIDNNTEIEFVSLTEIELLMNLSLFLAIEKNKNINLKTFGTSTVH